MSSSAGCRVSSALRQDFAQVLPDVLQLVRQNRELSTVVVSRVVVRVVVVIVVAGRRDARRRHPAYCAHCCGAVWPQCWVPG